MTHRLKGLENRGLVQRLPNRDDARSVLVQLTPDGLALIERALEAHVANERNILAAIAPADLAALDARLSGLLAVTVGLLGVRQTMAGRFYHERLAASGIATLTPSPAQQDLIHDFIYNELIHNRISAASRVVLVRIIEELVQAGAKGVILGCTEIPLLIRQQDVSAPIFNTTEIHCQAAVEFAFQT